MLAPPPPGGGGVIKKEAGRRGSLFHNWIDYHGVTFSLALLEWGSTFSDFWGKTVLHIYGYQTYQNVRTVGEK